MSSPLQCSETLDLATVDLPDGLSVDRETLVAKLSKEDATAWFRMDRFALLHHLFVLGLKDLLERQKVAAAFRRKCKEIGFSPPPPPPPPPPPAPAYRAGNPPPPRSGMPYSDEVNWVGPILESGPGTDDSPVAADDVPTSDEALRIEVRRMLLTPEYAMQFAHRDGYVKIHSKRESFRHWTQDFGECADRKCGCYRLRVGSNVRTKFRNLVVKRTVEQFNEAQVAQFRDALAEVEGPGGIAAASDRLRFPSSEDTRGCGARGVRYVSIGCGRLLTDFEILCGLQEKGLAIESIILCDTEYKPPREKRSNDVESDDNRCDDAIMGRVLAASRGCTCPAGADCSGKKKKSAAGALKALGGFFSSARLSVFHSMTALQRAASKEPHVYGCATTFVHCDSSAIATKGLASQLLVEGGMWFYLGNGSSKAASPSPVSMAMMPLTMASATNVFSSNGLFGNDSTREVAVRGAVPSLATVDLDEKEGEQPLFTLLDVARSIPDMRVYRVIAQVRTPVHAGGAEPSTQAQVVGHRFRGTKVLAHDPPCGHWVRVSAYDPHAMRDLERRRQAKGGQGPPATEDLHSDAAGEQCQWMLADGSALGLGQLLELVADP
jgi:hypothetical protein